MKVLLYIEAGSKKGQQVHDSIAKMVPQEQLSVYTRYSELRKELADPFIQQHTIVVLAVESTTQLAVISEDHIMKNHHRLIAVIPIQDNEAAILGYRLKARYIGDINDQLENVKSVLKNMISNTRSQEAANRS